MANTDTSTSTSGAHHHHNPHPLPFPLPTMTMEDEMENIVDDPNVRIVILEQPRGISVGTGIRAQAPGAGSGSGGGAVGEGAGEEDDAAFSMSFQISNEDHTLGNALRYIIMKNPEVEFCGYSIPHPSESKLNLRIQTYGKITAIEALKQGLRDLYDLCNVVIEKFKVEGQEFGKMEEGEEEDGEMREG